MFVTNLDININIEPVSFFSQDEIKAVLSEPVSLSQNALDPHRKSTSKRRKELANFMGSLLQEMAKAETSKVSESNSVLLGG